MIYVKALRLECPDGFLTDVLEEEQAKVVIVDRVQHLGLANGEADGHRIFFTKSVDETFLGGGCRGRGGGSDCCRRDGDC